MTEVSQSANTVTVSSSQSPTLPNVVVDAIEQKSGDNGGAIAGGIVGGIVILLIVVGVLIIVYKRKRMNRDKSGGNAYDFESFFIMLISIMLQWSIMSWGLHCVTPRMMRMK